eukprot:SAG22_NODE_54_length_23787_cov_12.917511_9_plen_335_part_00
MANQHMNARKCGSLLVQPEDAVGDTTAEDVAALKLQHQCECWEMFGSVWGLRSHRNSCARAADAFENEGADADGEHQVEAFLDVRGRPDNRFWRIKWAGKDETGADLWPDTGTGDGTADFGWQSERNLNVGCVTLQNKFWRDHRALDRRGPCDGPEGEHRCQLCNTFFKSGAALRRHQAGPKKRGVRRTKANSCRLRPKRRRLKGTEVDRMVQREKRKALLNNATQVRMEGRSLHGSTRTAAVTATAQVEIGAWQLASDGSRPSDDEGGWPLEEMRGLLQRPMQWEGVDGMASIPQDAREEALAARMRDWSISAYGGSVVSAELSLSQVSRPND